MKQMKGSILLFLTALIWGFSFVAQSVGMNYIEPFTFQAIRTFLGCMTLLPIIFLSSQNKSVKTASAKETKEEEKLLLKAGILCGIFLCIASSFQQFGVKYTTVGKAGFITAMYILIVPLFGSILGKKISKKLWCCIIIAIVGLYLLCMQGRFELSTGDTLVAICALFFSFHIMAIDHYADKVDGIKLSCLQFFVTAIISTFLMFVFETPRLSSIKSATVPILYSGILSCGGAYTLQILGQKHTEPYVASLIMSFESVFALLGGMLLLHQIPSIREISGCILMFTAIIIIQLPERK